MRSEEREKGSEVKIINEELWTGREQKVFWAKATLSAWADSLVWDYNDLQNKPMRFLYLETRFKRRKVEL